MREKLIQYVDLLFTGAGSCEDIKQEILQNTLDRYDDLIAEGKAPEAAYRLAIIGIGDVNEILGTAKPIGVPKAVPRTYADAAVSKARNTQDNADTPAKKAMRAAAIGLYILCPVPLLILAGFLPGLAIIGVCGTLAMVAVATVLIVLGARKEEEDKETQAPGSELQKSIGSAIWAVGLAVYFLVSFTTGAWYVTWLVFPITAAVKGLVKAILDLKEVNEHEN